MKSTSSAKSTSSSIATWGLAAQSVTGQWERSCCVQLALHVLYYYFFCCLIKLSLSQPTNFNFCPLPLHPAEGEMGRSKWAAAWSQLPAARLNHNTYSEENFISLPEGHQHHLSWQQTRTLSRTRYFTYGQLYLRNKYKSTFILSREMESCMQRIMVSKILVRKYRKALKEDSHLVLLQLTIILLQFLFPV